jgi:hypothetical protein
VTLTARFALLAILFPASVSTQTLSWNVDVAATGTFTPLGGSDSVGFGPAVSVAVTREETEGESSHGIGVVGTFMTTWAGSETNVPRRRENWLLAGVRGNAWDCIGLIAMQAVGGVKAVSFSDSSTGTSSSATYGVFGLGISFNMPPVGNRVLIRALDVNWFLTPGDPVSSHRFSIGFGIDILAGQLPFSKGK